MAGDAELVKSGVDAALAPIKDFANRLFGPAIDELGGILADPIRIYRFKRSVRLLEKVERICDNTGFEPRTVPLKTLLPILENASLEDDEGLHDRWANLLANAAAPDVPFAILPSFSDILRQLTARHAILMDSLYEWACAICRVGKPEEYVPDVASVDGIGLGGSQEIWSRYASLGFAALPPSNIERLTESELQAVIADEGEVLLLIDDLVRLRLLGIRIHAEPYVGSPADKTSDSDAVLTHQYYHVSALGFRFVNACRNPKSGQRPIIQT